MRLINTRTLKLEQYFGENIPPYAILSHTWGVHEGDEVTYQDWQNLQLASRIKGYTKILYACRQAQDKRLDYLWVDTNCIDKTSSAELTEAINSMFQWYRDAEVCFAYMADVFHRANDTDADIRKEFLQSRWFTRGWTLQELLAPRQMEFFFNDWSKLGSRHVLGELISQATGIEEHFLNGTSLENATIATRMSWLSRRQTTRVEDMAYCMLGIFDINMPLLYGEGMKAFIRLQEEIIKVSNDHTLFCWNWREEFVPKNWGSMIAPHPATFQSTDHLELQESSRDPVSSYQMTNVGLRISLRKISTASYYFAALNVLDQEHGLEVCIPLCRVSTESNIYARLPYPASPIPLDFNPSEPLEEIYVRQKNTGVYYPHKARDPHNVLITFPNPSNNQTTFLTNPPGLFNVGKGTLELVEDEGSGIFDGVFLVSFVGTGYRQVLIYVATMEKNGEFFGFVEFIDRLEWGDISHSETVQITRSKALYAFSEGLHHPLHQAELSTGLILRARISVPTQNDINNRLWQIHIWETREYDLIRDHDDSNDGMSDVSSVGAVEGI